MSGTSKFDGSFGGGEIDMAKAFEYWGMDYDFYRYNINSYAVLEKVLTLPTLTFTP